MPIILVLLTFLAAQPARAAADFEQFTDGTELWRLCESKEKFSDAVCSGYIVGVIDAASMFQQRGYCFPAGLSRGEARAIVIKWMTANPLRRDVGGAGTIYNAMAAAFPCRK